MKVEPVVRKFSGAKIKEARAECGMSQKKLAEFLECTTNTIRNWETGVFFPDATALVRMEEVLGRPMSWYFLPIGVSDAKG